MSNANRRIHKKTRRNTIMKVFVYGTLKEGFYNHKWLRGATKIGYDMVSGYGIQDLGAFPAAIPNQESVIFGEVYHITPEIEDCLDILEGYKEDGSGLYDKVIVSGEHFENMTMYYMDGLVTDELKSIWNKKYKTKEV